MPQNITLKANAYNPVFEFEFEGVGTFPGGEAEASTKKIQFNIQTASTGPEVVYVSYRSTQYAKEHWDNAGVCVISVPQGYRIKSGQHYIDQTDSYTRAEDYNDPKVFSKDEIAKHIQINFEKINTTSCQFRVVAIPANLQGTVNIIFTVTYEKAT